MARICWESDSRQHKEARHPELQALRRGQALLIMVPQKTCHPRTTLGVSQIGYPHGTLRRWFGFRYPGPWGSFSLYRIVVARIQTLHYNNSRDGGSSGGGSSCSSEGRRTCRHTIAHAENGASSSNVPGSLLCCLNCLKHVFPANASF